MSVSVVLTLTPDEAELVEFAVDGGLSGEAVTLPTEQRVVIESLAHKLDIAKMAACDALMGVAGRDNDPPALSWSGVLPTGRLERAARVFAFAVVFAFLVGVLSGLVAAAVVS